MAHFALVAPPLRGHLDPMAALGRALARRGHRVTLCTDAAASAFAAGDLDFRPIRLPAGPDLVAADRQLGPVATIRAMAKRCDALCDVLPGMLRELRADAVICDQTEPGGALSALGCGLPHASLAAALPLDRDLSLPPPFVDWRYSPRRQWLYEGGHRVTDWLMRPLDRIIARRAAAWGLPEVATLDDTFSRRLQLLQLVPGLEFPRAEPPASFRYVGPLREAETGRFDVDDDGRPLAFCTLGTLQGHRAGRLAAMAGAVAAAGFRPVVAHAGGLTAAEAAALPGDPIVADFLPQRAVLARCRLAVAHGGMNTVLDALAAGVPLVVTPLAYEQGAIAARLAGSGAGLILSPRAGSSRLADACRRIARDPGFAAAAGRLSREITAAGGAETAVSLLEEMIGRPPGTIAPS